MRKQSPLSPAAAKSLRMHSQRWMLMVDSRVGISVPFGKCVRETHHPLTANCFPLYAVETFLGGLSLQVLLVDSLCGRKFGTESSIMGCEKTKENLEGCLVCNPRDMIDRFMISEDMDTHNSMRWNPIQPPWGDSVWRKMIGHVVIHQHKSTHRCDIQYVYKCKYTYICILYLPCYVISRVNL